MPSQPTRIHHDSVDPWLRCSYGGIKSINALNVTCKNCLRKIKNRKKGRPQKSNNGKTIKRSLSLTPEADLKLKRLAGQRSISDTVNELILKSKELI